jgi:hypothetical protein
MWHVSYLITTLLAFLILPFFKNFFNCEEKNWRIRLKYALQRFFLIIIIQVFILGIFVIYLYRKHTRFEILAILIALANSFGFFLVILALGYSLVAIPRKIKNSIINEKHLNEKLIKLERIEKIKKETMIIIENNYKLLYHIAVKFSKENPFKQKIEISKIHTKV